VEVLVADPFVTIDDADIRNSWRLDDLLGRRRLCGLSRRSPTRAAENSDREAALYANRSPHAFFLKPVPRQNLSMRDGAGGRAQLRGKRIGGARRWDVGRAPDTDADGRNTRKTSNVFGGTPPYRRV